MSEREERVSHVEIWEKACQVKKLAVKKAVQEGELGKLESSVLCGEEGRVVRNVFRGKQETGTCST